MTVPVNASAVDEMKSNGVMRQRGFLLDSITFHVKIIGTAQKQTIVTRYRKK